MHAARLREEEKLAAAAAASAKALRGFGAGGAFKQSLGRSKSSRNRSPGGGGKKGGDDEYLDVLEAVDASANEARDLAQQNAINASKNNAGGKNSTSNSQQSGAAASAGPLSFEAQMAALAAGLSDSDSDDDDDDLTASTDGGRLNAAERSAAEAANLEKKAARAQQVSCCTWCAGVVVGVVRASSC